jgi:hypothetical protein
MQIQKSVERRHSMVAFSSYSRYTYSMIIEQTVEIPADHRLILDLPCSVPAGVKTRVVTTIVSEGVQYKPLTEKEARQRREDAVKNDPQVQKILKAGAAQAEARKSGSSRSSLKQWYGVLADSRAWGKELDAVAEIRRIRNEWGDLWEEAKGKNG